MNRYSLFQFLITLWIFSSCISESKKGITIPPVPEVTAKARREAAIAFLTDAIESSSNNSENYYKRALLYLENGNIKDALEDINNAIGIKANVGDYFQAKALILRDSNQPQLALEAASKAEVLNTESPELYTLLGDLYQQLGQYGKSRAYLRKALQISPNNGETYFYQGEIAAKMGDSTLAMGLYQQTLGLKPSFLPAYLKLIQSYTNMRQYDLALLYSREALKYHPQSAALHLQRGNTYNRTWKLDSAIMCYKKAISLDTNLIQASFSAGQIYFKSRLYRLALPFFMRTLNHNPKYPDAKFYVAQCLEYTGEYVKAEEYYNQMLAENAQDYKALGGITRTQRKEIYGEYIPNEEIKYDTAAFPKFVMPKRTSDTNVLKPLKAKGIDAVNKEN
jgi:tetratricopeptide (TPR) repeat protein